MNYFEQLGYVQGDKFGWRMLRGMNQFHRGTDIHKADRSRIDAFVPGIVRHAKFGVKGSGLGGYGNCVAIEDKYGALHVYGHLSSISVSVGQYVAQGQQIGTQGATGDAIGSHLHYEVRRTASPNYGYKIGIENVVEPTNYVVDYYAKEQPTPPVTPPVPSPVNPPVTPPVMYYPKSSYTGPSIVDAFRLLSIDSSFNNRAKIAAKNGISGYRGTSSQNTLLLNLLKAGKLVK